MTWPCPHISKWPPSAGAKEGWCLWAGHASAVCLASCLAPKPASLMLSAWPRGFWNLGPLPKHCQESLLPILLLAGCLANLCPPPTSLPWLTSELDLFGLSFGICKVSSQGRHHANFRDALPHLLLLCVLSNDTALHPAASVGNPGFSCHSHSGSLLHYRSLISNPSAPPHSTV